MDSPTAKCSDFTDARTSYHGARYVGAGGKYRKQICHLFFAILYYYTDIFYYYIGSYYYACRFGHTADFDVESDGIHIKIHSFGTDFFPLQIIKSAMHKK